MQTNTTPQFYLDRSKCITGANIVVTATFKPDLKLDYGHTQFIGSLDAPESISRGGSIGIILGADNKNTYEFATLIRGTNSDVAAQLARRAG